LSSAAHGLVLRLIMGLGPMPRRPLEHPLQPMEPLRGFRRRLGDFAHRIHLRKRELRAVFPPVNPGGASAGYTVGVGRIGWSCRLYRFVERRCPRILDQRSGWRHFGVLLPCLTAPTNLGERLLAVVEQQRGGLLRIHPLQACRRSDGFPYHRKGEKTLSSSGTKRMRLSVCEL